MLSLSVLLCVSLVLGLPTPPYLIDSSGAQHSDYNFFFIFGNSYTNYQFDPSGIQPSPSNPLGNTALAGFNGALAGGPNWAVDLTNNFNSTPTLTYDFAYNCATVDANIVAPCNTDVKTIIDQVNEFQQIFSKGSQYGNFTEKDSLFAVWIGINDAHLTANNANIADKDIDGIMHKVADVYVEKLGSLYDFGARNFLLLNVPRPAFDRTPQITASARPRQQSAIKSINTHLFNAYHEWKASHPDVSSILIDTAPIFNEALDSPSKIGKTNSTCDVVTSGPNAGCVWQDDFHPGVNMHRWIAEHVAERASKILEGFFL